MSYENENLWVLPFGTPEHQRRRRVLRTIHLSFAFAQLRAEIAEKDLRGARRFIGFMKILDFPTI